ncbi:MAG: hypothetical protein JO182_03400 [Acidobacteriaceae bacterium]|nr:hypothetical protein [Acidobacteriaceae bacterium]MBV9033518.1 hypothetical protein [Acidobacteriaceae bacterium]MBV9679937.1 hypothetical protein [Acidobacteriaceae bacterium]
MGGVRTGRQTTFDEHSSARANASFPSATNSGGGAGGAWERHGAAAGAYGALVLLPDGL